jgi:hypothetical protein
MAVAVMVMAAMCGQFTVGGEGSKLAFAWRFSRVVLADHYVFCGICVYACVKGIW